MSGYKKKRKLLKIGTRIAILPFLGLLGIAVIQGINIYVDSTVEYANKLQRFGETIARQSTGQLLHETNFIRTADTELLALTESGEKNLEETLEGAKKCSSSIKSDKLLNDIEGSVKKHIALFKSAVLAVTGLKESRAELTALFRASDDLLQGTVDTITTEETNLIMVGDVLPDAMLVLRSELKEFKGYSSSAMLNITDLLAFSDAETYTKKASGLRENIDQAMGNMVGLVNSVGNKDITATWQKVAQQQELIKQETEKLYTLWNERQRISSELDESVKEIEKGLEGLVVQVNSDLQRASSMGEKVSYAAAGLCMAVLILLSIFVVRSIVKPLKKAITELSAGTEQVAMASNQVFDGSNYLAEAASEQAASIEETSSSLEEMTSMTKQNAENAGQASDLMNDAKKVVSNATETMTRLTSSMTDINRATEETSKIIKAIDEIAFQTNLLALNAAVEAARAGEAGAGFAVVADEVRNLAMRAADAAKNTSDLINEIVGKVEDGSALVSMTREAFELAEKSTSKAGILVAEIAQASDEQAQGISQVNTAISQMDQVTQKTAASAEESTSLAQSMKSLAENMKINVLDLTALVGNDDKGKKSRSNAKSPGRVTTANKPEKAAAPRVSEDGTRGKDINGTKEISPERLIPLEGEDFSSF